MPCICDAYYGIPFGVRIGNIMFCGMCAGITPVPTIVPMPVEHPLQAVRRAYDGIDAIYHATPWDYRSEQQ